MTWENRLQVVTEDSWATRNERLLRYYLHSRPEQARRYAALKRWVSRELGLPRVPVWE